MSEHKRTLYINASPKEALEDYLFSTKLNYWEVSWRFVNEPRHVLVYPDNEGFKND